MFSIYSVDNVFNHGTSGYSKIFILLQKESAVMTDLRNNFEMYLKVYMFYINSGVV